MLGNLLASRRGPMLARGVPAVIYLLGILCFLSGDGRLDSFPLDDAWIHRVYARAFAGGHGFEYNTGVQEAGATSPLWVIVTSPPHWFEPLGTRVVVFGVKIIGIILGIISILIFYEIVGQVTKSPLAALVAASLLALEPRLLFSSLSGMETPLLVALWLGGLHASLKNRWILFAVLFGLTPVTRPESLVILPVCAIVFLLHKTRLSWWKKVMVLLSLGFPFVLWSVFCEYTTGHWLPNTYYLKSHPFRLTQQVLIDTWRVVASHGFGSLFIFLIGVIVCTAYLMNRRQVQALVFIVVGPLIYVLGVAGTRQIVADGYYYWTRWIDPASVLLTACFALGYSVVLAGNVGLQALGASSARRVRALVSVLGAIGLLLCVPSFARSFRDQRSHLITDCRAIDQINVQAGLWINEHIPPDAVIGVNDAGAIRYFGARYTIDLLGMNYQNVTFQRVNPPDLLSECDVLAIFPSVFRQQQQLIERYFEPVMVFHIPPAEYTICDCPGQATKVIFRHK